LRSSRTFPANGGFEPAHEVRGDAERQAALRLLGEEVLGQGRDVLAALAQRRDVDAKHLESEVEV